MNAIIAPLVLLIFMNVLKLGRLKALTRTGYESIVSSWTTDAWCIRVAMALYDNLGVKFSIEDDEPFLKYVKEKYGKDFTRLWLKKMVIRKDRKTVDEFNVNIVHRTIDEFEDKIWKISRYGMPSIGCPPFSNIKELEMKLEISGDKKLDKSQN